MLVSMIDETVCEASLVSAEKLLRLITEGKCRPLPALESDEVANIERRLGVTLDMRFKDLLRYASGFRCPSVGIVDFTGKIFQVPLRDFTPSGLALAQNRSGNVWVADILQNGCIGCILYFSHDPPVVLRSHDGIINFLLDIIHSSTELEEKSVRLATEVYNKRERGIQFEQALLSDDPETRHFAQSLSKDWRVFDLRKNNPAGINWETASATPTIKRYGDAMLFAIKGTDYEWLKVY